MCSEEKREGALVLVCLVRERGKVCVSVCSEGEREGVLV